MKKKAFRARNDEKSPAKRTKSLRLVRVAPRPGLEGRGFAIIEGLMVEVALGPAGIRHDKREGDNATPAGVWRPQSLRFRADHGHRPVSGLPLRRSRPDDGWCDAPQDGRYNRPVRLPFAPSHEKMWREDGLYDLVVILDHNQRPRRAYRGSAVFIHLARPGFLPTAGCVAFRRADLRRLLARLSPRTKIVIGLAPQRVPKIALPTRT